MEFKSTKGLIALDIDGTVTAEAHEIDEKVVNFLYDLTLQGWSIFFITGRPFAWSQSILHRLPFPHLLAVQNGAIVLDMPSGKIVRRRLLEKDNLSAMSKLSFEEKTDFVIYSGYENHDICYFRPKSMPQNLEAYLSRRVKALKENWVPVEDFTNLPVSHFASFKCFAEERQAKTISETIERQLGLHAPPNRDPFDPNYYVIQVTHPEATKGSVLREVKTREKPRIVIAAGDDYNDLSMLKKADIKIVMATAPEALLKMADVIAPPAAECGIIDGLERALRSLKQS